MNIRNRIYEVFERDILAEIPGKLEINGYYTSCYFNASKKSNYYYCNGYMVLTVTMISDSPDWIMEKEFMFLKNDATQDDKKKSTNILIHIPILLMCRAAALLIRFLWKAIFD